MKDSFRTEKNTEKDLYYLIQAIAIQDSFSMIALRVKEYIRLMNIDMRDSLKTISFKEKDNVFGSMGVLTKGIFSMEKDKVLEHTSVLLGKS